MGLSSTTEYPAHQKVLPPELGRFSLPGKQLLVSFINRVNNLQLIPDQLVIKGDPLSVNDEGLTELKIAFAESTGWGTAVQTLTYIRLSIGEQLLGMGLTIYVDAHDKKSLLDAIFQQAGLYLEADLVSIDQVERDISVILSEQKLSGFSEDGVLAQEVPPAFDNRDFIVTIDPKHLMFFGSFTLKTRQALRTADRSIDSLLDLRRWYATNSANRYPIDLLIPGGNLKVGDLKDLTSQRVWESELHGIKQGAIYGNLDDALPDITPLLTELSGVCWVLESEFKDYNLTHARVVYNGRVSAEQQFPDPSYSYVLALELAGLCTNVSGILKIGYRYSTLNSKCLSDYDPSAVPPIILQ